MKWLRAAVAFVAFGLLAAGAHRLQAQTVRVGEIFRAPSRHVGESRMIEGVVQRFLAVGQTTTQSFVLEDDYGQRIQVRLSGTLPSRGSRVTVTGIVALDTSRIPYLIAQQVGAGAGENQQADAQPAAGDSTQVPLPVVAPPPIAVDSSTLDDDLDGVPNASDRCPATTEGVEVDPNGCEKRANFLLIGGLGLGGLVLLVVVILLLTGRRGAAAQATAPQATASPAAPPPAGAASAGPAQGGDDSYDGKTIKFSRAPSGDAGTLKMLPGRLEIVGGADKGRDIRFVKTSSNAVAEITFGRNEGPAHTHIQLKSPTVSRKHALLRLEGGTWHVLNLSETNPVVLNGRELAAGSGASPLTDGDTLELGEVSFRFRAR